MRPTDVLARWGIDAEYVDARGRVAQVDAQSLARILAAVSAGSIQPQTIRSGAADRSPGLDKRLSAYYPAFVRAGARRWLVAAQLYGLRSHRNWGHGDFTDLADLIRIAARAGAAGVGVNPLHALFPDDPERVSPYSPSSRLFLSPLYIDMDAVPEFGRSDAVGIADEIARLRANEVVNYPAVWAVKLKALRAAFEKFPKARSQRRDDFEAFRTERGEELERFAAFQVLRGRFGPQWTAWPTRWRAPSANVLAELKTTAAAEMEFHAYVQWLADRQLGACRDLAAELGMPVGLYLDIAVGVAPDGADAWTQQEDLLSDLSIGAPPDLYNVAGQNWGLAAFNPHALAARDFAAFRRVLQAAMRYAGAVRLDHVLGLNRIYVVPSGLPASQGGYLRYPFDAMLAAIAEESQKAHCLVIGEDLGTVPEGFVERLAAAGIFSYRVMLFERARDGSFRPPEDYPAAALVTFNTHDLPTFAGWLTGSDLKVKRRLGLDPGETDEERAAAQRALRDALAAAGLLDDSGLNFVQVARFLARTPTSLLAASLEDAIGAQAQPNVPGTVNEYPNWRQRLPVALDEIETHAGFRTLAAALRQAKRTQATAA